MRQKIWQLMKELSSVLDCVYENLLVVSSNSDNEIGKNHKYDRKTGAIDSEQSDG